MLLGMDPDKSSNMALSIGYPKNKKHGVKIIMFPIVPSFLWICLPVYHGIPPVYRHGHTMDIK